MGKPVTLLESLCAHALNLDSQTLVVEHNDSREWVFIQKSDGAAVRVANWASSSSDAKELLANLRATAAKPARTLISGAVYIPKVRIFDSNGHDAFEVKIDPAPKLDSSVAPKFTAKQGQYLAFIHKYITRHGEAPSEGDVQRHFFVSAPSANAMMQTLQKSGLIARTPGKARSIRLLVKPEHLPKLG